MLSDINNQNDEHGMKDPVLEDVLLVLVTRNEEFNKPFQVANSIRSEKMRQAKATGRRAMEW